MTPIASTFDSVRALASAIREHADRIEQERRFPEALVRGATASFISA